MEHNEIQARTKEIIERLENTEIRPMTEEETAILIKGQITLANTLMTFTDEYINMKKQFELFQEEFTTSQYFIGFKGLSRDYLRFKDKRLKVLNRNRKSK